MPARVDIPGLPVFPLQDVQPSAEMLSALADANRLQILSLLAQRESCVCEIMSVLGLGQSLVSHHLGVLRRAGLVQDRRDGRWVYYSLDPGGLKKLSTWLSRLIEINELSSSARFGANQNPNCFITR